MKDITDIDLLPLRSVNHYTYKCENALVKAMEALDKNNIPGAAFQIGRCLGVNAKICEDVRVFLTKLDEAEEKFTSEDLKKAAMRWTKDTAKHDKAECANAIAIVFGFLATVSVNLWLTWRMCRVIEAILAD